MKIFHTTVFSDAPGGGNPCPVTLDADGMTGPEMQRRTAELGLESVFILRSARDGCCAHLRYFVPRHEMEMCVHATIAATAALARDGRIGPGTHCFETLLGDITVELDADGMVCVHQFAPRRGETVTDRDALCRALRIGAEALLPAPVCSYSTSRMKLMIPLRDRAVLDALRPDFDLVRALCGQYSTTGFYPFALERTGDGVAAYARQFPENSGYPEDAATGVAACALGAYLVENALVPSAPGWNEIPVYQGQAMGRPSLLRARAEVGAQGVTATAVRGRAAFED